MPPKGLPELVDEVGGIHQTIDSWARGFQGFPIRIINDKRQDRMERSGPIKLVQNLWKRAVKRNAP